MFIKNKKSLSGVLITGTVLGSIANVAANNVSANKSDSIKVWLKNKLTGTESITKKIFDLIPKKQIILFGGLALIGMGSYKIYENIKIKNAFKNASTAVNNNDEKDKVKVGGYFYKCYCKGNLSLSISEIKSLDYSGKQVTKQELVINYGKSKVRFQDFVECVSEYLSPSNPEYKEKMNKDMRMFEYLKNYINNNIFCQYVLAEDGGNAKIYENISESLKDFIKKVNCTKSASEVLKDFSGRVLIFGKVVNKVLNEQKIKNYKNSPEEELTKMVFNKAHEILKNEKNELNDITDRASHIKWLRETFSKDKVSRDLFKDGTLVAWMSYGKGLIHELLNNSDNDK